MEYRHTDVIVKFSMKKQRVSLKYSVNIHHLSHHPTKSYDRKYRNGPFGLMEDKMVHIMK